FLFRSVGKASPAKADHAEYNQNDSNNLVHKRLLETRLKCKEQSGGHYCRRPAGVCEYNRLQMKLGRTPIALTSILASLLALPRKIFGNVRWNAPEWLPWTGLRLRDAIRWVTDTTRRVTIAAASVLVVSGGVAWYELRPRPNYVGFEVTSPKLTTYDERD